MRRVKRFWLVVGIVGAVAFIALSTSAMRPFCAAVGGNDPITVPLSQLTAGRASFFCYHDAAGDRLRFILARDADGKVHSVVDACRQCGKFHEGYTTAHGELICRFCGNKYHVADIERGLASCVPLRLPSRQGSDHIEIRVSDLKQVSRLF